MTPITLEEFIENTLFVPFGFSDRENFAMKAMCMATAAEILRVADEWLHTEDTNGTRASYSLGLDLYDFLRSYITGPSTSEEKKDGK